MPRMNSNVMSVMAPIRDTVCTNLLGLNILLLMVFAG